METTIEQTLLPKEPSSLPIHHYFPRITDNHTVPTPTTPCVSTANAKASTNSNIFGVSISQLNNGMINRVAFATDEAVYVIDLNDERAPRVARSDQDLRDLLKSPTTILAGFDMPRIALRLHHHIGHHVRGVDLSTLFSAADAAWLPSKVLKRCFTVRSPFGINRLWHENDQSDEALQQLCLRAWISAKVAGTSSAQAEVASARRVDTSNIKKDVLSQLGTLLQQTDILARAKPKVIKNEYDSYKFNNEKGKTRIELRNARFKTRVRPGSQSYVEITSNAGTVHHGKAVRASGKTAKIELRNRTGIADTISSVRVVGLDDPSPAEKDRGRLLLEVLQNQQNLLDAKFIRFLWFRTREDKHILRPTPVSFTYLENLRPFVDHLNPSQAKVVAAMTSEDPIVIVHGPPGTGKTTTISAAAEIWSARARPSWIIGHSNVSVKNIAEKLTKRKVDFKLIVSKEFYIEWHEHIYEAIPGNCLIRSDELPKEPLAMSRLLGGSKVILSTLGLLSNAALKNSGVFNIVPLERLVIDEASQINVFEYMTIFHHFRQCLGKVCFFGDPKQLPPFGKENAETLESIFDIRHLKSSSYLLDVQYRMPVPLGTFISSKVYGSKLKSSHKIVQHSCVRFVDTPRAGREEKRGTSWINKAEISVIVNLVRNYYQKMDFCIITPYDSQRAEIEKRLKAEELPWEKVFNVDSFQGEF
ncbi:P-loop containing nucleoside triphosphate hydrolase protein [Lentinula raphanica]|uniref:P-loop containing nucleoside triphosphate hydrolase protein n=1 Tax=Lentinula raphanica TaxID=153919 RepID=A0AA38PAR4_9AGAR|nr:P-loop containing nucleoside triphosphate hydrolase protein [Lentinula raphanica]